MEGAIIVVNLGVVVSMILAIYAFRLIYSVPLVVTPPGALRRQWPQISFALAEIQAEPTPSVLDLPRCCTIT